jgi:hypothetical protein
MSMVAHGLLLPLTMPDQCCGAARHCGHSCTAQHFVGSNVGVRTNRTCTDAAIADAAFARNRCDDCMAVQHFSPKQPFKLTIHVEFQTYLSPHGARTHMSWDFPAFCTRRYY